MTRPYPTFVQAAGLTLLPAPTGTQAPDIGRAPSRSFERARSHLAVDS